MVLDEGIEYVMADSNVMIYLSAASLWAPGYDTLRAGRRIAISFQVRAELGGYPETRGWGGRRQEALALLLEGCVELPHGASSNTWYARVNEKRRQMKNAAGDADVWVVAQALEYGLPLMVHDGAAIELARAMGVEVLTLL
jgi:predicted nucleic acid-binding protein